MSDTKESQNGVSTSVDDKSSHSSDSKFSKELQDTIKTKDVESASPSHQTPAYSAFPPKRQLLIVFIATAAGFFSPVSGAVYLPSLKLFESIFKTTPAVINASVSVYWAVFGVAPLFGAPASDFGGRKSVYIWSLAIFLIANALLAALPPTLGGLFSLRVFQAIGSSMVTAVGAGVVADVTEPAKRASRMGLFLMGPQLGPLLGPLIGGQFSDVSLWRWVFGFLCLACIPVYVMVLFLLPETLRCLVGNGSIYAMKGWLVMPRFRQKQVVEDGKYPRPPRFTPKTLFGVLTFVPNCIVTLSSAFNFAGLSAMYIIFPTVWQVQYGWSGSETGYAYLAPGIFLLLSSVLVGRFSDFRYRRYKAKHDGKAPAPEWRVEMQVFAYLITAAGKSMFGWFIARHYHPVAILVAISLAAVGTGAIMILSTSYQTECMPTSAASLVALAGLLRNIGSAVSGSIIDSLLKKMGYGWFFTGLGILDATCIFGLIFIRFRGHLYRAKLASSLQAGANAR